MKCISCNEEIPDIAKFCPYCGSGQTLATELPKEDEELPTVTIEDTEEAPAETVEEAQATETPVEEVVIDAEVVEKPTEEKVIEEVKEPEGEPVKQSEPVKEKPQFKMPEIHFDFSVFKPLLDYVKNPFAKTSIHWGVGLGIGLLSILMNALMIRSLCIKTFEYLFRDIIFYTGYTGYYAQMMEGLGLTWGRFLTIGLLITMAMFIVFTVGNFGNESKNMDGMAKAMSYSTGMMLIPVCMNVLAAILFQFIYLGGLVLMICSFVTQVLVVNHLLPEKTNSYLRILVSTLYVLFMVCLSLLIL